MGRVAFATIIDPFRRVIRPALLPLKEDREAGLDAYEALLAAVSTADREVRMIERVDLGAGHAIYVDEEGLLANWDSQAFFRLGGPDGPTFAGIGVIVGETEAGGVGHCLLPEELIRSKLEWIEPRDVRVPAPVFQSINPETGSVETEYLTGSQWWTYDNQPC